MGELIRVLRRAAKSPCDNKAGLARMSSGKKNRGARSTELYPRESTRTVFAIDLFLEDEMKTRGSYISRAEDFNQIIRRLAHEFAELERLREQVRKSAAASPRAESRLDVRRRRRRFVRGRP